jgi:hypothetical protein
MLGFRNKLPHIFKSADFMNSWAQFVEEKMPIGKELAMKWTFLFSILISVFTTSCAMIDRSFLEEMDRDSDSFFQAGRDFPVVGGDSGQAYRSREEIKLRTPASERTRKKQKEEQSLKSELFEKEQALSEIEMNEYLQDSKYLPGESDKLYYLSLAGAERSSYMKTKKDEYKEDHGEGRDLVKSRSIHSSEISLGMTKTEVEKLWGKPAKIQVAGNPKYQNELWLFQEDGTVRQVYFESGKVNGWALDL